MNKKEIIRRYFSFVNFANMIKVGANNVARGNRPFMIFEDTEYKYRDVYRLSSRYAHYFLAERKRRVGNGTLGKDQRLAVGIYQENTPQFVFACFGAGLSNSVIFAINTGFRGATLKSVIEQARIKLLLAGVSYLPEVERLLDNTVTIGRDDVIVLEEPQGENQKKYHWIEEKLAESQAVGVKGAKLACVNTDPVLVIYTSGTTGMPKAVPCSHLKLVGAGSVVQSTVRLSKKDRGYICMPLFHSNSWYVGLLPIIIAGASFVLKRRFSATAFESDILKYGVSYMNYVGQPLHYIIAALEKKYGDSVAVEMALAHHPKNRFRIAYGNGASTVDRKKLQRYFGMKHLYEIYGSTEAVITTANRPGDPIDSVGRADASIVILDEQGQECEPARVDGDGKILNYERAVGEISRKIKGESLRFDGYFANENASRDKFQGGYYRSGDLGHIRIVKGKRYLFFNGRTDDWIRKDGENFSADTVAAYALKQPGVKQAIAYGAPCEVSDEKVMVAIELEAGCVFNPKTSFLWYLQQQSEGGMDPKWMPDYIRIVDAFTLTDTQKIMVRPYKREHFDIESHPQMVLYFRERGDTEYRRFTDRDFRQLKQAFIDAGRQQLLLQK
ncbi:MAG: AMP-binding protein [Deltaproteobacteria bacterium]|nr:AMP-binding protein [Deltaproteobacteria bacterium]